MTIFSYKCTKSGHVKRVLVKKEDDIPTCKCNAKMEKVFRTCPDTKITEKRDHSKNKNIVPNIEQVTRKRSKEYFVQNHVDEAIQKIADNFGEKEAIAQAKRNGWIDKRTGKVKRKDDLN